MTVSKYVKLAMVLGPFSMLVSGCASMTKAQIDKPAVSGLKQVAIVGFNMDVKEPKSLMGDFKAMKDMANGKVRDANEEHDAADQVYTELAKRLQTEMQWNVKPQTVVNQNAEYKEFVQKYTKGLQMKCTMMSEDYHRIRPHGVVDADPFLCKVKPEQRDALMKALGVDALVVNFQLVGLENESTFGGMVGRAQYKPKAQNVFRVFIKGKKDPVWFDSWAWGEGDKALQANLNFVEDKPLLEQIVIASRKSIAETMTRYKTY